MTAFWAQLIQQHHTLPSQISHADPILTAVKAASTQHSQVLSVLISRVSAESLIDSALGFHTTPQQVFSLTQFP